MEYYLVSVAHSPNIATSYSNLQFNANRGELDFAYRLGKIYYQGSIYHAAGGIASGGEGVGAVPQSFQRSMHYFMLIARKMWPRDPTNPLHDNPSEIKDENDQITRAILSAGYIGRMYLRGEGVKRDYGLATMWFRRGAQFGDRESQNGLGILWRDGLVPGHKDSIKTAVKYFNLAADELLAESLVHLAKLHYGSCHCSPWFLPGLNCFRKRRAPDGSQFLRQCHPCRLNIRGILLSGCHSIIQRQSFRWRWWALCLRVLRYGCIVPQTGCGARLVGGRPGA